MQTVANLTLESLQNQLNALPSNYAEALRTSCDLAPPPYGMAWYGDKYRDVSRDPWWLANSLIANAAKEGEGSSKLWTLVARTSDPDVAEQIRLHAVDEARHAKLYIKMLDTAFPGAVDEGFHQELIGLSPGYSRRDRPKKLSPVAPLQVLDELIQMNIGEIRTRIHQLLLRPVILAHAPIEARPKLTRILDSLLSDETRHIAYTASLIEQATLNGHQDFVYSTMARRLVEFNHITLREVGETQFDGA